VHNLLLTFPHKKVYLLFVLQGEYRVVFEKIYSCDSSNNSFQFNVYLSKKTSSTVEVKGNITFFETFDDTVKVSIILY